MTRSLVPRAELSLKHAPVFIHSMPKTGTTSMGCAFAALGYRDCGCMPSLMNATLHRLWRSGRATDEVLSRFRARVDALHCDVFSDYPLGHATGYALSMKVALWSNASFVWINRNLSEWYRSWKRHGETVDPSYSKVSQTAARRWYKRAHAEVLSARRKWPGQIFMARTEGLDWTVVTRIAYGRECTPNLSFPHANQQYTGATLGHAPSACPRPLVPAR